MNSIKYNFVFKHWGQGKYFVLVIDILIKLARLILQVVGRGTNKMKLMFYLPSSESRVKLKIFCNCCLFYTINCKIHIQKLKVFLHWVGTVKNGMHHKINILPGPHILALIPPVTRKEFRKILLFKQFN